MSNSSTPSPLTAQLLQRMPDLTSVDDLFQSVYAAVPSQNGRPVTLNLPPAMDTLTLTQHMAELAAKNTAAGSVVSFLGAGSYDHFIPPVVEALANQSGFVTAYTPYQAEASQGALQALFEYQSMLCDLTGMDVANTSLYDGATALAEAVLMARDLTKKTAIILPESVHPNYRQVVDTVLRHQTQNVTTLPTPNGVIESASLTSALSADTAAVVISQVNIFGIVERLDQLIPLIRQTAPAAMVIVVIDPIALGVLKRPGDFGADIVVGEGQPLGLPMAMGGPSLGLFATRTKFLRRMPGRIVGQTTEQHGDKRAFCLTLQTREQHIKRERATSNVCTNAGVMAIRAAIYLAAMGPQGLRRVAELCLQNSAYLMKQIATVPTFCIAFTAPTFKEFVVRSKKFPVAEVQKRCRAAGFLAGVDLGRWFPSRADELLIAVTEKHTRAQLDAFVAALRSL